jgi:cysteine desulfurase
MKIDAVPDQPKMNQTVYLDNNATTALDPEVFEAMAPYLQSFAGNPSSQHARGRSARRAVDQARRQIADSLDVDPREIIFTSGATEANNLAILSIDAPAGSAVLVNPAEHPSSLEPARSLERRGYSIETLSLDSQGRIADVADCLSPTARLAVIQLANSETGCVQAIDEIFRILPDGCRLHCDAAQAVGKIPVSFHRLGADSLTISGHKIHGPPGIGALLVRHGVRLTPLFTGGRQQQGYRPGTEPVALIAGLAKAIAIATARLDQQAAYVRSLRDRFEASILSRIDGVVCNGAGGPRLPNTSNLSFLGADVEALLIALDLAGVYCSAGTACASGSLEPSPTLLAMGLSHERVHSAVRFSLSRFSTAEEVDQAVAQITRAVGEVRASAVSQPRVEGR